MKNSNLSHYQDFTNLDQWLYYLENLHCTEIDLGLSRIGQVANRLAINLDFAKVITVAGTNGKGTTCAFIENALLNNSDVKNNPSVAVYSSPHIDKFNERLRINKVDVGDTPLIDSFKKIEDIRGDISLSYYEYTTLAALLVLMDVKPDYIILEVGLGGRLDATNIIDADIAVITTVDLDHQAFLGNDRESIGFEKAGIMRANQQIVIGDTNVPNSVLKHARCLEAVHGKSLFLRNKDFLIEGNNADWNLLTDKLQLSSLIPSFIPQNNVATAIMVLKQLDQPLSSAFVNSIITMTKVPGRTELIHKNNHCDVMLDVGHNPQATKYLANHLEDIKQQNKYNNIYAVVAMLGDKDIKASLAPLSDVVEQWYTGQLDVPRAASNEKMLNSATKSMRFNCFDSVGNAFKTATKQASSEDLVVVFGSFFTVAEIRSRLN